MAEAEDDDGDGIPDALQLDDPDEEEDLETLDDFETMWDCCYRI